MAGRIRSTNHRADRGADHDIGHDALGQKRADHPDMGKATGSPAAERKANHRLSDAAEANLFAGLRPVGVTPDQTFKHRTLQRHFLAPGRGYAAKQQLTPGPTSIRLCMRAKPCQNQPKPWFMWPSANLAAAAGPTLGAKRGI